jgi:hypothetical protein
MNKLAKVPKNVRIFLGISTFVVLVQCCSISGNSMLTRTLTEETTPRAPAQDADSSAAAAKSQDYLKRKSQSAIKAKGERGLLQMLCL